MRRVSLVLFLLLVHVVLNPMAARADVVCDERVDPLTQTLIKVNCRTANDPPVNPPGGTEPRPASVPMMWVRMEIYQGGAEGYVGACLLVPVADGVPRDHARVSAADCGIEPAARPSQEDVERLVRSLSGELRVPEPSINLGPDPSVNEWKMAVIGHPLWLWTDTPRTATSSHTGSGLSIEIRAELAALTFDMGDGRTVRCSRWTRYTTAVRPGAPSPTCGHTYQHPSLPARSYMVTATADWSAHWTAMGYNGTLPLRSVSSRAVPVGELQAVVVQR